MSTETIHTAESNGKLLPWLTAIMMVLGIAVLAALYWNKNVTIGEVKVVGNHFTTSEIIVEMAQIPIGIKPDSLDLGQVVHNVEGLDYVRKVIPYVEPSGDLRLTIHERLPIAILINNSNEIYVDAEGIKLPILVNKIMDLPLVYGFSATMDGDTLKSKQFTQVRDFLINARKNEFSWATISEVAFSQEEGIIALSHENGVKLIFGRDEFGVKLRNWEAFYSEVIRSKGIQSMQQVDLRFTNQIVTRES